MADTVNSQLEGLRRQWREWDLADRLAALREPWCDANQLLTLYGLKADESWLMLWRSWARKQSIIKVSGKTELYHRHRLETFFQQQQLLPVELAALRLGTTAESLQAVIEKLREEGSEIRSIYVDTTGEQLVNEAFIRDFSSNFDSLKFHTFGNHTSYCQEIHKQVKDELGVEMQAVKCITAQKLGEDDYAHDLDVLDLQPMGIAYQVWLDLKKPINLRPDACSTMFYVQNEPILCELVFAGVLPDVPGQLRKHGE